MTGMASSALALAEAAIAMHITGARPGSKVDAFFFFTSFPCAMIQGLPGARFSAPCRASKVFNRCSMSNVSTPTSSVVDERMS